MNKTTLIAGMFLADALAAALFGYAIVRQRGDGSVFSNPLAWAALALFFLAPILLILFFRGGGSIPDAELLRTGLLANATVLESKELPFSDRVSLKVRVNPPSAPSYEAKTSAAVSPLNPSRYVEGALLRVRVDPRNPRRVVVDDGSAAPSPATPPVPAAPEAPSSPQPAQPDLRSAFRDHTSIQIDQAGMDSLPPVLKNMLQAAMADNDHDGIPDIMEKGNFKINNTQVINLTTHMNSIDPQERIAKMEKLVAAGLITQEQFDKIREAIEKGSQGSQSSQQ